MERYTQFRDKATGISPFMPVTQSSVVGVSDSALQQFLKTSKLDKIGSFIFFVIKFIISTPIGLLSVLFSNILGYSLVKPLSSLYLTLVGVKFEVSIENLKSRQVNSKFYPSKNELYFINFTGPLDLVSLIYLSNDEFVSLIPNKVGILKSFNKYEFLLKSLGFEIEGSELNYKSLQEKIVYVFAEGTTSNGKAILPFALKQETFNGLLKNLKINKIKSIGIKTVPSTLVTPLKSDKFEYYYKLMINFQINLKLRINNINELNPVEDSLIKIRNSFVSNGKFKLVSEEFTVCTKQEFIKTFKN